MKKVSNRQKINNHLLCIAGQVKTKSEAVKAMLEKNLMPFYGDLNIQKFRDERYWNEEVDNLYKSHFPIFDFLYKTFG